MGLFGDSQRDQAAGEIRGVLSSLKEEVKTGFHELKDEIHGLRADMRSVEEKANYGRQASEQNAKDIAGLQVQVKGVADKVDVIEKDTLSRAWMWPWLNKLMPFLMIAALIAVPLTIYWFKTQIDGFPNKAQVPQYREQPEYYRRNGAEVQ